MGRVKTCNPSVTQTHSSTRRHRACEWLGNLLIEMGIAGDEKNSSRRSALLSQPVLCIGKLSSREKREVGSSRNLSGRTISHAKTPLGKLF